MGKIGATTHMKETTPHHGGGAFKQAVHKAKAPTAHKDPLHSLFSRLATSSAQQKKFNIEKIQAVNALKITSTPDGRTPKSFSFVLSYSKDKTSRAQFENLNAKTTPYFYHDIRASEKSDMVYVFKKTLKEHILKYGLPLEEVMFGAHGGSMKVYEETPVNNNSDQSENVENMIDAIKELQSEFGGMQITKNIVIPGCQIFTRLSEKNVHYLHTSAQQLKSKIASDTIVEWVCSQNLGRFYEFTGDPCKPLQIKRIYKRDDILAPLGAGFSELFLNTRKDTEWIKFYNNHREYKNTDFEKGQKLHKAYDEWGKNKRIEDAKKAKKAQERFEAVNWSKAGLPF